MERQTLERVDLYARRQSPGTPSHCISHQSKSTTTYQWIARSGLSQGA
jgi:hypothetical protein